MIYQTQQQFLFRTHGGSRKGAGRPRKVSPRSRVPHRTRETTKARFPVQVTVRMKPSIARLRNFVLIPILRRAFVYGCKKTGAQLEFRICQFSIQGNHIHLMCEAANNAALARGMQGWSVRVARGLNKKLGREGTVF